MGSLEEIDAKSFVIKVRTAEITRSRPYVRFYHLACSWELSYHQYSDTKRFYELSCTGEDNDEWNIDASITFDFFKQDGTKGITRSVNYLFNAFTRLKDCIVKVTTGLPIADFNAVYSDAEVHVKIHSLTGFPQHRHYLNFKRNTQLSDVALIVEGEKLFANKAVLATFSPVFRAMFFSGFKEATDGEVVIKDAEYEAFLQFLEVMHNAYSKISDWYVESLLVLADRYDVGVIMEKCDNYFISTDYDFTDPKYVELAETYNLPKLHKKCSDSIDEKRKFNVMIDAQLRTATDSDSIKPITEIQRKTVMEFDKEDDQLSDFAFVFEGKKLFVNKAVLATFSSVFRTKFFSEFKESTDNEMIINDANYDDFEQFLRVIHTPYPLINDENIETILAIADRYKVDIVMEKCESYLLSTDDGEIEDKLRLAETYSFPKLHEKIMDSIDKMDGLTSLSSKENRLGPLTLRAIIQKMASIEDRRVAEENLNNHRYAQDYYDVVIRDSPESHSDED